MKILLDCRLMVDKPTGISRYSEKLLTFYIDKYGVDNVCALVNATHKKINCQQIVTSLKPFNIFHWFLFPLWINKLNFDWLISFHYSGLAFKLKKTKSIVTVHDLMFELVPGFFNTKLKGIIGKPYFRLIVKQSLKNAHKTICVSETTKIDLNNIYKLSSSVSGEGLFLEASPAQSVLDKYNLNRKGYYIYIGNNRPHKNVDFLKESFQTSRENLPLDTRLVLVGHEGINQDGIIYTGIVSDEELVSLYNNAIAFVFPSKYEGFGLPILEALANSCPVIASDIPAFREFENDNIYYFELGNKKMLSSLLIPQYEFYPLQAEVILDKFSWQNTYSNLNTILDKELCLK